MSSFNLRIGPPGFVVMPTGSAEAQRRASSNDAELQRRRATGFV
jgi:hypothetical protein